MGVYLENGIYVPGTGEVGWDGPVDADLAALDALVGGGGGGGGSGGSLNLIDASLAPYGADVTGDTFSDTAIQNAFDTAFNLGPGSGVWLPGIFKVKSNLAHFEIGGLTVRMPRGAKLLLGDDTGGDSLFSSLGRHGYSNDQSTTDIDFIDVTVDGNGRLYKGGAWADWWQGENTNWVRCVVRDLLGSAFLGTACTTPALKGVRITNSGDGENGAPAFMFRHNDEAGQIQRLTVGLSMEDVWILDSDDYGGRLDLIDQGRVIGCVFDGSGPGRSAFYTLDLSHTVLSGNIFANADEDGLRMQSRGNADADTFSRRNLVVGNIGYGNGSGVDIHEAAYNTGQTHFENTIDHNVGVTQRD